MGAGLFFIQGAARQPAAYEVIDSRFVLAAGTVLRNHPGLEGGHVRPVGETELHVVKTELFLPVILVEGKLGIVGRCAQIVQVLGDQNPGPFVGGRFLRRRFRGRLFVVQDLAVLEIQSVQDGLGRAAPRSAGKFQKRRIGRVALPGAAGRGDQGQNQNPCR